MFSLVHLDRFSSHSGPIPRSRPYNPRATPDSSSSPNHLPPPLYPTYHLITVHFPGVLTLEQLDRRCWAERVGWRWIGMLGHLGFLGWGVWI